VKLVCPECGLQGDLIAFLVDGEARLLAAEFARVPAETGNLTARYLGLFKPAGRALALHKATRLVRELADAMQAGAVPRKGRDWPTSPAMWRQALETMLDARERLTLPLKTHGYLFEIVAGLADRQEAREERVVEQRRRSAQHRAPAPVATEKPSDPQLARSLIGEAISKLRGGPSNDA
jgi:hypothetical protein